MHSTQLGKRHSTYFVLPADLLGNPIFESLPSHIQMVVVRLFQVDWLMGFVPDDVEEGARLCNATTEELRPYWVFIRKSYFEMRNEDGGYNHQLHKMRSTIIIKRKRGIALNEKYAKRRAIYKLKEVPDMNEVKDWQPGMVREPTHLEKAPLKEAQE